MTRQKALTILEGNDDYIGEMSRTDTVLDGHFTIEQLHAIVWLIENPDDHQTTTCPTCGGTKELPSSPDGCPDVFHNRGIV